MIIILGPPGSGKGTQVRNLSSITSRPSFSAGDYLKVYGETHPSVKKVINEGHIIETDEVNEYLTTTGIKLGTNSIFDGFPRTEKQLNFFLNYSYIFEDKKICVKDILEKVFILNVSNETLENRLLNRYICNKCFITYHGKNFCCNQTTAKRIDDMAIGTIHNRINNYYKNISIIKKIYTENHINVYEINGEKSIEEVSKEILDLINI